MFTILLIGSESVNSTNVHVLRRR